MNVTDFTSRAALTDLLHSMAKLERPSDKACRFLLEMRAHVDGRSSDGKTPLQTALACNNLSVAKILVDHNALVTPQDKEDIERCLMDASLEMEGSKDPEATKQEFVIAGYPKLWLDAFMGQRPRLNEPQVWSDGRWKYLFELSGKIEQFVKFTKPVALFLYADEPGFWKNYGMVTRKLLPAWDENYEKVAEYYTPARAFIREPKRVISVTQLVRQFFAGLPLEALELDLHAISHRLTFSTGQSLHQDQDGLIKRMVDFVAFTGTIGFWGCSTAEGEDNFVQAASRLAKGRAVFGSPHTLRAVGLTVHCSAPSGHPILIPTFLAPKSPEMHTAMYRNGQLMAQGQFDEHSGPDHPIFLACRTFLTEQAKTFFESNKPKETESKTPP